MTDREPPRPLPTASPSSQGVDARGVLAFLDALEAHPQVNPHSVMLVRHGAVVAQGWWSPFTPSQPHLLYSLSKSFTSVALGFAVAEGLLSLDDRLVDVLPDLRDAAAPGGRAATVRLRDLAAMSSGHVSETWGDAVAADPDEPLRGFLGIEPDREPGSVFAYNQPCTYALATAVQRVSGQTLTAYLRPRLFEPLGLAADDATGWQQHPPGRDLGFTGLHATTGAVARLGLLHLQRGAWQGRQLLPREWFDEATRAHVANPHQDGPDWRQGYGFQLWMARHGYRGDGAYGQFMVVLPEHDAVLALTSESPDMQAVLDAAWEHLLPALGEVPTTGAAADAEGADAELAARLVALTLPVAPGEAAPSSASSADWDGVALRPSPRPVPGEPPVAGARLEQRPDGWHLVLTEVGSGDASFGPPAAGPSGWVLDARIGGPEWAVTQVPTPPSLGGGVVPVAVSGGWVRAGDPAGPEPGRESVRVEVQFLQTPHRLVVSGDAATATLRARWVTTPLRSGGLAELRSPLDTP